MNERRSHRSAYPTAKQKKKLIEMVAKHPDLISCKVKQGFNHSVSQGLWQNIAAECNAIPGAKKTWRQWKKTWQDIRSKTKKRHSTHNLPASLIMLSQSEKEALGLKMESSSNNYPKEEETEFVTLQDSAQESLNIEADSAASYSEAESLPEEKVFHHSNNDKVNKLKKYIKNSKRSNCFFSCDMLSVQEQRKIQLKENYLNFKKDYLRQKLKLMKEQTEALRDIARELSK